MKTEAPEVEVDTNAEDIKPPEHLLKPKLIPSSVPVSNNLTIKAAWIHCRASGGCCAIFKNLRRLLHHERDFHGWRIRERMEGGYAGTYKVIKPPPLQVVLRRSEVEDKLRDQSGQRILRRRRPRKPPTAADSSDSEDPDFRLDDENDSLHSSDNDSDDAAGFDVNKSPSGQFECLKCTAQFSTHSSLKRHLKKPRCFKSRVSHSCEICGLKFSALDKVRMHKFSLHGVKSFPCTFAPEVCTKRFCLPIQLKAHMDHVHLGVPRKHQQQPRRRNWFTCDKCPQEYTTEKGRNKHFKTCLMRMHEPKIMESKLEPIVESVHAKDAEDLEEPEQDPLALSIVTADITPQITAGMTTTSTRTGVEIKKEPGTHFADSEDHLTNAADENGDFKFVLHEVGDIDIKEEGRFITTSASSDAGVAGEPEVGGIRGPSTPQLTPTTTTALAEHANSTPACSGQVIITSITSAQNQPAIQDEKSAATQVEMPAPGCLICPVCVKDFKNRKSLRDHIDRHNGKLVCTYEFCGKRFGGSWNLKLHMLTHTNEAPYKCSHCGVGFKTMHGRRYHERREHTRDLPFACQYCDKKFVSGQYCKVHELRAHTREKNYSCSYCDKKFIMKPHLVEHERRHTGEKPLLCTYCGRGFARSGDRRDHHKRHQAMIEKMRALGMADEVTEMLADKSTSLKKA